MLMFDGSTVHELRFDDNGHALPDSNGFLPEDVPDANLQVSVELAFTASRYFHIEEFEGGLAPINEEEFEEDEDATGTPMTWLHVSETCAQPRFVTENVYIDPRNEEDVCEDVREKPLRDIKKRIEVSTPTPIMRLVPDKLDDEEEALFEVAEDDGDDHSFLPAQRGPVTLRSVGELKRWYPSPRYHHKNNDRPLPPAA